MYGCILPNNTAESTYILDTTAPVTFTNKNSTEYLSRQLFYQSPDVQNGEHTLIVNVPDSTIGLPWTTYCFDYVSYVPSGSVTAGTGNASPPESSGASGSGKRSNLKVILPAVLVPCLVFVGLLVAALYVHRRRLSRLRAKVEQASTPYTQSSKTRFKQSRIIYADSYTLSPPGLLHRPPAPMALDTKSSTGTATLEPNLLSPRPDSSYSSEFQVYQPTIAELGSTDATRPSARALDEEPPTPSPPASPVDHRSMTELIRGLVSRQTGGTRRQEVVSREGEISAYGAPPTYASASN